jgi:HK97 family phage major capsid protein
MRKALDSSVVFGRARKIPQTSNEMEIPNEATGVTTYWTAEAADITTGEPTQGVNKLIAKKIAGRAVVSTEQAEDSLVATMPYLQSVFGEAIGRELDQEALEGNGTNFTGVETEASINKWHSGGDQTTGATVVYSDLVGIAYAGSEAVSRQGAAWFMHSAVFGSIVNLQEDSTTQGTPILMGHGIAGPASMSLLGYPVYLTDVLDVAQTVSVPNCGDIYFGNPQDLIFGINREMRFGVSEHAQWTSDKLDFKVTGRFGFTVGVPSKWTQGVGFVKLGG